MRTWKLLAGAPWSVGVLWFGSLALVWGAGLVRPLPFTTTDDNWMYFLPLIKAHTDALLQGEPLRVLWGLGAGWSPWENAQVGVLYLPYHVANLLARMIGHPLALLEVSAWLHLGAAGLVAYSFTPPERGALQRLAWGLVATLMSGPLLLGLNWHNYLTCYPWFLALAFLLRRVVIRVEGESTRGERLALGLVSLGFFLSAHAQMYLIGIGLLGLWALAEAPRASTLRGLFLLGWAQVPLLVPLIYLKTLASVGTADWMGDRGDPFYLLRHAQSLSGVIHGTVFGNLLQTRDFQLWANISWVGVGMFFSPGLVLLGPRLWRERRWALMGFFLGCLAFMGAASFPGIRYMAVGPLEGFRWTWKLCIFVGPLALATLIPRVSGASLRWPVLGPAILALLSLGVFLRGLSFEIWPSLAAAHPFGAERLVLETRRMSESVGLAPGTRIALAGPLDMVQPLPLPVLGLVGNAPILAGLESAHLYEPMEPDWVSRGHLGLSLPWRVALPAEALLKKPEKVLPLLASVGVQAVVTLEPEAQSLLGARSYQDPLGRMLWVVPVPGTPKGAYPATGSEGVSRDAAGCFSVAEAGAPPPLLSPRPVVWKRSGRGWRGCPQGIPWGWALATLMVGLLGWLGLGSKEWAPSGRTASHG